MFQAEETGSGGKSGSKSTEEQKNKIHSGHRRKLSVLSPGGMCINQRDRTPPGQVPSQPLPQVLRHTTLSVKSDMVPEEELYI